MKLVCKCSELVEAERVRLLLEERGIPAHVSGQEAYHLQLAALVSRPLAVWVYLDEHVEHAKALLDNDEHFVNNAVNVQAFYEKLQESAPPQTLHQLNWKLIYWGITLILLMIVSISYLAST